MYWAAQTRIIPRSAAIVVDPLLCIGWQNSAPAKALMAPFLEGCPWDAIDMVPLAEFEAEKRGASLFSESHWLATKVPIRLARDPFCFFTKSTSQPITSHFFPRDFPFAVAGRLVCWICGGMPSIPSGVAIYGRARRPFGPIKYNARSDSHTISALGIDHQYWLPGLDLPAVRARSTVRIVPRHV